MNLNITEAYCNDIVNKIRPKLIFSVSWLKDNLVTAFEPLQRLNPLNHCSLPDIPNVHLEDHKYISLVSEWVKLEHAIFSYSILLVFFRITVVRNPRRISVGWKRTHTLA